MSLPFLLSRGPSSSNTASRLRNSGGGKSTTHKHSSGPRTSIDTSHQRLGVKRGVAVLDEEVAAPRVAWDTLLEEEQVHTPTSFQASKVCVVVLSELGSQLAECLASKAGLIRLGIHDAAFEASEKYRLLPGITTQPNASDAAKWADLVVLCGSYEEGEEFLNTKAVRKNLRGKCVLNLANGTPQEAEATAASVKKLGARYLDACLLSDGTENVFGNAGTSLMVCGDRGAWEEWQHVVLAAAPAAFFGGQRASQANALGVALCTFMTSVYMGLQQAKAITSRFGVPSYLLPKLLTSSFMPVMKRMLQSGGSPLGRAKSHSRATSAATSATATPTASLAHTATTATQSGSPVAGAPHLAPGTPGWRAQLERIRAVCRDAGIEHDIIDGFLASGACGGRGGGSVHNACDSVHHGGAATADGFDSNRRADGPVPATALSGDLAGLDLMDLSGLGAPVNAVTELGAELMTAFSVQEESLEAAWAP